MKKQTSVLTKISQKKLLITWIIFHVGILMAFLGVLIANPKNIKIEADLFNMIPKSLSMESIKKADEKMTSITGQNVFILVANKDFSKAKTTAEKIYTELSETEYFESVSLYNDVSSLSDTTDFLFKYRWNMLDNATIEEINAPGGAQNFAMNALAQAYSGFTMLPLDNLESDPFMLTEHNLNSYLNALQKSGTAMTVTDGVLASQKNDEWFVMIRGVLNKKGSALASKKNGVTEIYRVCNKYETTGDGTRFVYSGTAFHSHKSSTSASREISIIATVSMLIVILMLFLVFKTTKPILFSVGSILISITVAFLSTLAVFKNMHIITLVFGTSLIGSCIDYSLHYFTHWAGNEELKTGEEIRNHLIPGLTMAICSTGICFAILLFAPFTLLKQMSLFCLVGLISSYLTTIAVYPYIKLPVGERKLKQVDGFKKILPVLQNKVVGRVVIISLFAFAIISILICKKNVKIENNILSLYKMQGKILDDEIEAAQIIQYSPSAWFIIDGESEEDVLANEERIRNGFDELTDGKLGYLSTSLFIPSVEQQKKSREACKKLLDLADEQLEYLGFDLDSASKLRKEFELSEGDYVSFIGRTVPLYLESAISSAWLGEIDGKYYTVLLPNKVEDYQLFKNFADSNENVYLISKSADVSRDLDKLTLMVLKFFAVAYVLMFIMLKFFYNWKRSLKIISVPLLIILVTVAVFAISKIKMEFFSVTGLILVFGLGLDYIIYMMENEKNADNRIGDGKVLEPFATMLSFVTTVISFGALALSQFQPVHLIGLAIFLGLTTAYVSSFFYGRSGN